MKILFVIQNYYPSIGGSQIFFQTLAEGCARDYKDEIIVLTTNSFFGPDRKSFKKIEKKTEIINKVKIRRFNFVRFHLPILIFFSKIYKNIFGYIPEIFRRYSSGPLSNALARAIKSNDADVIFAGTSSYLYMNYPLKKNKKKKPFIFQGAIHFKEEKNIKVIYGKTLKAIKLSNAYLSNTDFEKERLIEMGIEADKIFVGGSCIDINIFKRRGVFDHKKKFLLDEHCLLAGYIGRIESTKSIEVLLRAIPLSISKNDKIHFVIAGYQNPAYFKKLIKIVENLDIQFQKKIYFLSDMVEKDKVDLMQSLDIFVTPSENESFGMVFLEAWACKKPVIGTSIGAIRSVVSDMEDGLLFEPGNEKQLAEKINLLAADRTLRTNLGEKGHQKVLKNYTRDIVIKNYRDIFIQVINQSKKSLN